MRIFLAGATGVVGRRAVPLLAGAGHEVTALGRSPEKLRQLERMGARPVTVDLFAAEAVRNAAAGHDAVVNLATHIPPGMRALLPWAWRENDRLRRIASANLCEAALAAGARRFIQESFAPVYPDRGEQWIEESTPLQPVGFNRSILDAERVAERFATGGGVGITLRFGAFYGPDAVHMLDLIRLVRRGWAPMPGRAASFISSVSHDDAAGAVVAALGARRSGVHNVVDDEPLTHRDYVDSLAAALDVPPPRLPPAWMTPIFGSVGRLLARSLRIDNRKLRGESNWLPRLPSARDGWPEIANELRPALSAHRQSPVSNP